MKIKLAYPKMPGSRSAPIGQCIAFEKYDGTNLHWVWDPELGWHAFGTRRDRFDLDKSGIVEFADNHPELQHAASLFKDSIAEPLTDLLKTRSFYHSEKIIVFTEFLGPSSFAGKHKKDEAKQLILLDVQIDEGFLAPDLFIDHFAELPIANEVYRGKLTGKFATDVREGRYNVPEGVVCKGGKTGEVWMIKIKTDQYMLRLKNSFASDWENYWE